MVIKAEIGTVSLSRMDSDGLDPPPLDTSPHEDASSLFLADSCVDGPPPPCALTKRDLPWASGGAPPRPAPQRGLRRKCSALRL